MTQFDGKGQRTFDQLPRPHRVAEQGDPMAAMLTDSQRLVPLR